MKATITVFPSLHITKGARQEVEVEAFLQQPRVCTSKQSLPLFTFATFKDDTRDGRCFDRASMLGFDVDEQPVPNESQIIQSINGLGLQGFYHTSSSYKPGAERWRLFIPFTRLCTDAEYRKVHAAIRKQLNFPVGTAAKDPTRAWFVPAKGVGSDFIYGEIKGEPANPDNYADETVAFTAAPYVGVINLPPDEDKHDQLLAHLVANWPGIGKRDEAHMALSGTLAKLGYGPDYVARVVAEVSEATGSDKGPARASMVRRTFEKIASGSPVAAWGRLSELIGSSNAEQISTILALKLPAISSFARAIPGDNHLPVRSPGHVYSYTLGDAPRSELKAGSMSDIIAILVDHVNWSKVLRWNVMSDSIVAVNPPMHLDAEDEKYSRADTTAIRCWLESTGVKASFEMVDQAVEAAAKQVLWNPIESYLKKCGTLEATGAIDALATKAFQIEDSLSKEMLRKHLIAACRRACTKDGVKVDTMLVFRSPQGRNKTQFIELLFGPKYVRTNLADIHSKDSVQELQGIWAVEFGELASISNMDQEAIKEFLTRSVDKYRPSYGRFKIDVPRHCVFFGTTNNMSFLKDETGNRRFWVIDLDKEIDLAWVKAHRDEIWSEAYNAMLADEPHWFDYAVAAEAETRTKDFLHVDAWGELIWDFCVGKEWVRIDEIYQLAICGGDPNAAKSLDERAQRRITKLLTIFGAKTSARRENNRVIRAWHLPSEFRVNARVAKAEIIAALPAEPAFNLIESGRVDSTKPNASNLVRMLKR